MEWQSRLPCVWVLGWLAASGCTYEGAGVAGDLTTSEACPDGERCTPRVAGRLFLAAEPPAAMFEEDPAGELPPVARGATTWVRYVEPHGYGVVDVPGARFDVDGDARVDERLGRATLATPVAGTYVIRVVDESGALFDRTRIRVEDIAELSWVVAPGGPSAGWRVWPGANVHFGVDARSVAGERLVVLNEALEEPRLDTTVPASGVLEVQLRVGYETLATSFPVAGGIESVVGYAPDDCLLDSRDGWLCLYGVEDGSPIVGVPLTVEDRDDGGELITYSLNPEGPCVARLAEPRVVVVVGPEGERFSTAIPPVGNSCPGD